MCGLIVCRRMVLKEEIRFARTQTPGGRRLIIELLSLSLSHTLSPSQAASSFCASPQTGLSSKSSAVRSQCHAVTKAWPPHPCPRGGVPPLIEKGRGEAKCRYQLDDGVVPFGSEWGGPVDGGR